MNPTGRTAVLLGAVALGALVIPLGLAQVAFTVVGVAFVVDAVLARTEPRLRRSALAVVPRGVPVRFGVSVLGPRPESVRVRQPRTEDLRVEPPEADGGLDAELVALRRGRHTLPAVAARRVGPLGLAAWTFRGDGVGEIVVYPDVPRARRIATAVRHGRFAESGRLRRGPLGLGTEFESVRDYQADDDVRQINWIATVRTGRPMSNQYRVEQDRELVALLDTGRLMSAPLGDQTRLDAAIDALVAVAAVSEVLGDRCGVIAFDDAIRRSVPSRRRGLDAVLAAVYDLEPRAVDSDHELAFRSVRNTKRALVVVFTDLLDVGAAESLVHAVPVLARRHAVLIASATDPDVRALAEAPVIDARRAWEATVAHDVLAGRDEVVRRLRAAGAGTVEAPPEHLAEAVVAAYLRFKAQARL